MSGLSTKIASQWGGAEEGFAALIYLKHRRDGSADGNRNPRASQGLVPPRASPGLPMAFQGLPRVSLQGFPKAPRASPAPPRASPAPPRASPGPPRTSPGASRASQGRPGLRPGPSRASIQDTGAWTPNLAARTLDSEPRPWTLQGPRVKKRQRPKNLFCIFSFIFFTRNTEMSQNSETIVEKAN